METPNALLAGRILDRLLAENLISGDARKKLAAKLSEGKMKSEDWRFAVETAGAKGDAK